MRVVRGVLSRQPHRRTAAPPHRRAAAQALANEHVAAEQGALVDTGGVCARATHTLAAHSVGPSTRPHAGADLEHAPAAFAPTLCSCRVGACVCQFCSQLTLFAAISAAASGVNTTGRGRQ